MPPAYSIRLDDMEGDEAVLRDLLGTATTREKQTHQRTDHVLARDTGEAQPIVASELSASDAVALLQRLNEAGATATIVTADDGNDVDAEDLAEFVTVMDSETALDVDVTKLLASQPAIQPSGFEAPSLSPYAEHQPAMLLGEDGESFVRSESVGRLRLRALDEDGEPLAGAPVRIVVADDDGTRESVSVHTNGAGYISYDLSHVERTESTRVSVVTDSGVKAGNTVTSFKPADPGPLNETIRFDRREYDPEDFEIREDLLAPPDAADVVNDPATFDRAVIEQDGNCAIDFTTNVEVSQHFFNQVVRLDSPDLTETAGSKARDDTTGGRLPISGAIPPTLDRSVTDVEVGFPFGLDLDFDVVQSEQPTLGKLNTYKQTWTRVGHGIGRLLYSLALAPCEETNISIIEWSREESARRSERDRASERLQHDLHRDRTIEEVVEGAVDEVQEGGSTSVQGGGGLNLGFISIGGGAASSGSFSEGHRRTTLDTVQSISDRITQRSSAMRSRRSMVVTESQQAEQEEVRTRNVRNSNRNHALTVEYFQVLEHYQVDTRLDEQVDVLLVPYKVPVELWSTLPSPERFASQIHGGRDPRRASTLVRWLDQHAERLKPLLPREHRAGVEALYRLVRTPEIYERDRQRAMVDSYTVELNSGWRAGVQLLVHTDSQTIRLRNETGRDGASVSRFTGRPVDAQSIERVEVSFDPEALYGSGASDLQQVLDMFGFDLLEDLIEYTLEDIEVTAHTQPNRHLPTAKSYRLELETDGLPVALSGDNRSTTVSLARPVEPEFMQTTTRQYRDYALVEELVTHLQSNPMRYLRSLWLTEDADARALRLDRYTYSVEDDTERPLLELIENQPVGTVGNLVAFRLLENAQRKTGTRVRPAEAITKRFVSLPTQGVYAETLLSKCNATERRDISRAVDEKTACRGDAPDITGVTPGSRRDRPDTTPAGLPAPMVNIQNPPSAPAPTGTSAGLGILGSSGLFRDMSLGSGTVDAVRTLAQQGMIESGKSQRQATELLLKMLAASQGIPLPGGDSGNGESTVAPSGTDGGSGSGGTSAAERKEALDAAVGASVRNGDPVTTYDQLRNVEDAHEKGMITAQQRADAAKNIVGAVDQPPESTDSGAGGSRAGQTTPGAEYVDFLNEEVTQESVSGGILLANFAIDSSELQPQHEAALDNLLAVLGDEGKITLIEGRASQSGGEDHNQALSEERATAVRNYLLDQGFPAVNILTERGVGETDPLTDTGKLEDPAERSVLVQYSAQVGVPVNRELPVIEGDPDDQVETYKKWSVRFKVSESGDSWKVKIPVGAIDCEIRNRETGELLTGRISGYGPQLGVFLVSTSTPWTEWTDFETIYPLANEDWHRQVTRITRLSAGAYFAGFEAMTFHFAMVMEESIEAELGFTEDDGSIGLEGAAAFTGFLFLTDPKPE